MNRKNGLFIILLLSLSLPLAGCKKYPREEIHRFEKWTMLQNVYMIFPDGTEVSRWKDETGTQLRFQLADGTELMETAVITSFTPETGKRGLTGIDGMTEEAKAAVTSYYEAQGQIFDLDDCLKKAYKDYCSCMENGERFTAHTIRQEVIPSAETERYVAFLTALTTPKQEHFTGDTVCSYEGKIFDREDGSFLELKQLFRLDNWEEVQYELSVMCANDDTTVSDSDIIDAIEQADILVFQDYLEVWFPYGTWEKQEFDKGFGLKYDRLTELLWDWAIPSVSDNKEI